MKLSSRLSAAALTIAAWLAMGADQSALAQHSVRQQTAAVQTVPPGSGISSGLSPAFATYRQVRFRFVDPRGKLVNPKRIASVTLRSGTGTTRRVTGRGPVLLPAERTVPLEGGLARKSVEWSVQSVMVDGSNVVNRGQQRFVPGKQREVSISVLFFKASFSVRDMLFGFPLGSAIRLRFPDGRVRRYPLANGASLQLPALARGEYEVSVDARGISFTQPVSLSRDQRVALRVTSYLDVVLLGGAIGAIVLGLLLVRRPRLRATIRDRLQHVREQLRRAGQGGATGLVIFRMAGVAAIPVLVLVFLVGLFSGTDGGDSSQQAPKVAFAPPAGPVVGGEAQKRAQKTKTPGPQDNRNQRAREQAPGAGQPGDAGSVAPVVTPGPKPPQTSQPKPPQTSQPKPPQAPPPVSESPPAPVEPTVTVANNNTGPP
jgi:hypothetical protein